MEEYTFEKSGSPDEISEELKNFSRVKWKWKYNLTESFVYRKESAKREVYSYECLNKNSDLK
jgi:hypothetical protein